MQPLLLQQKIGFLGAGNMGQSLIGGLLGNGHPKKQLWACDHHQETLNKLHNMGIQTTSDPHELINHINILVIAVKPKDVKPIIQSLIPDFKTNPSTPLIISIAAGIQSQQIHHWLNLDKDLPLIRAMPNTPALLQAGITGLYADKTVSNANKQLAEQVLSAVGETVWISNENLMDVVTALSGSGPAYFFYMLEALISGAIDLGLPPETAKKLATSTALGAAKMAIQTEDSLEQLRQKVTSPGGTTEAGIQTLEKNQLTHIIYQTLVAATERGKTLSQQYN